MATVRSSILIALLLLAACGPRQAPSPLPAPAEPSIGSSVTAADGTPVFYYDASAPLTAYAAADRGAYVVALEGGASDAHDQALAAAGARAGSHLAGDRYIYRFTDADRARVDALPFATVEGPLPPQQRFDAERLTGSTAEVTVVIDLLADASPAVDNAVAELLTSWGARAEVVAPRTLRATVPRATIEAIAGISPVRWIEPR